MRNSRSVAFSLVLATALFAVGCTSYVKELNRRLPSPEVVAQRLPDAEYIVDPPDSIRVEFFNEPGLTRGVVLRQDGCITLPRVQDVNVGGLTSLQIREKLEGLYAKYHKEPRILVTVTGYNSKKIFVLGEVGGTGAQAYTGSQTVADVIAGAGGFSPRAAPSRCRVIRGSLHRDEIEIYKVNLRKLLFGGDQTQNVALAENDVIRVPPNVLAWIGYQIDNILFPFTRGQGAIGTATTYTTMVVP